MKRLIHIKVTGLLLLIAATACNKEECKYQDGACAETAPEGYMVTTMANFISPNVATIYKTTFNGVAPVGGDWNNPALGAGQVGTIATPNWNVATIGQVFGIAIDNSNNIYLAATDIYSYDSGSISSFGSGGRAGIYKTNVNTPGTTTTLVTTLTSNAWNYALTNKIPNSGVGSGNSIGNIAFDKTHNQLFVSNLEDGRIYRLDATTGNVKSVFDPFSLDVPLNGIVGVGERIWGVGVLTQGGVTEVYFARTEATLNSIWSIKLDAGGEFMATPQAGQPNVFNDSASSSHQQISDVDGTQNKISDIEFSCSGKMLLAERGNPHDSRIFEYKKVGTTWAITNPFFTGTYSTGNNSAGGVDYGGRETGGVFTKDDIVWGSQNAGIPVNFPPGGFSYWSYGVQGISSSGNTATTNGATDLFIDANQGGANNKGGIGDVDVFDSSCPCNN